MAAEGKPKSERSWQDSGNIFDFFEQKKTDDTYLTPKGGRKGKRRKANLIWYRVAAS